MDLSDMRSNGADARAVFGFCTISKDDNSNTQPCAVFRFVRNIANRLWVYALTQDEDGTDQYEMVANSLDPRYHGKIRFGPDRYPEYTLYNPSGGVIVTHKSTRVFPTSDPLAFFVDMQANVDQSWIALSRVAVHYF